ncbi:MAG: hypothetical protein CVU52_06210 [Deltaproteobacteria bacterium HGW-Deltaproteobacteria-10]|nr:MAG: hypothetical protein CVU52_06210 [Deltaproteobacteria bacterium HGW-Deltaproteobacteria-10]
MLEFSRRVLTLVFLALQITVTLQVAIRKLLFADCRRQNAVLKADRASGKRETGKCAGCFLPAIFYKK